MRTCLRVQQRERHAALLNLRAPVFCTTSAIFGFLLGYLMTKPEDDSEELEEQGEIEPNPWLAWRQLVVPR